MGVHGSKTTHMQVDIFFFQKFLLVKAAKLTTLFNQPVKSLFISELTVLSATHTLSPRGLAAQAQELDEIRFLSQGRVLRRHEDELPRLRSPLRSG